MKGSGGKPWGRRKSVLHFSEERFYILGVAYLATPLDADGIEIHGNI